MVCEGDSGPGRACPLPPSDPLPWCSWWRARMGHSRMQCPGQGRKLFVFLSNNQHGAYCLQDAYKHQLHSSQGDPLGL